MCVSKPLFCMKRILHFFLVMAGLYPASGLSAQTPGIRFFEGTWQEALEEADRTGKLIFVDAYATWCGPCKRMARDVFTKKEVGDYFNRYFINLKLDMEKGEGLVFREQYPVGAFPTLFFIGPDAAVVHKVVGGQTVEGLLRLGQFALGKADDPSEYARRFEEGDRDPELVLKYVTALNKTGKPSLKVVNDYLKSRSDLSSDIHRRIVFEGATEADSRVFERMLADRPAMEQMFGKDQVEARIEAACSATLMKAVEFGVADLHVLSKAIMEKEVPSRAEDFALDADLQFYRSTGALEAYFKACARYASERARTDPAGTGQLALSLIREYRDIKEAVRTALDVADQAGRHAETYEPLMAQAQVYQIAGRKKEAAKAAEKARKMVSEDPNLVRFIEHFIDNL